jgi:hypothetical protein
MLRGLDGVRLSRPDNAPLVFNFAELGAGPMLEQTFLRRLLADGVRPDFVLLEIAPLQLASGIGVMAEDPGMDVCRLSCGELRRLAGYYRVPVSAYARWLRARALNGGSSQEGCHNALAIDLPRAPAPLARDEEIPSDAAPPSPEERAAGVRSTLARYAPRVAHTHLADGPSRAVRDLIGLCRRENLRFAVIFMPECAALRELPPLSFLTEVDRLFADLRQEKEFEVIDGFSDGHHLHPGGARVFNDRLAREVLPRLRKDLAPAAY